MASHVLLVGGSDADAARIKDVLQARGRLVEVLRAADVREASTRLTPSDLPMCIVVSLVEGGPSVREWLRVLDALSVEVPVLALADSGQEASVERWLTEGGHDCLLRPHFDVLGAVLVRLERERAEELARETHEQRWRDSTGELVRLARDPAFQGHDLPAAFARVTEAAARGLQIIRASVWLRDASGERLDLVERFETRSQTHGAGRQLPLGPAERAWLDGLQRSRAVELETDTTNAPSGLIEQPGMALAVRARGTVTGVLCLEHDGTPRRWQSGEASFAHALADLLTLALESAERARAEQALRESEARFHELFVHSNDSIVLYRVTPDGRVVCEDINPAAERLSGLKRETTIGRMASDVVGPVAARLFESRWGQAIRAKAPVLYEQEYPLPAGRRVVSTSMVPMLNEKGEVHRLAAISRDITQQREAEQLQRSLEQQLAEAQKNEALARLASHIAHDVNNLLTVIIANAQRLQSGPTKAADVGQAILEATARGRELTQQVLTFGRRRPPERKPLDLAPLVRETLRLLEPTARGVQLREVVTPRVPQVLGDSVQLNQVLTNLCTNALQAMSDKGGTLTVTLEAVDVDLALARRNPPLQEGRWLRLTVEDTGVGMDEATARRIFEPFFSSRLDGSGTGLGLAVVQSIVQAHDGAIVVETQPGEGTRFRVYLPPVPEELARPGSGQHLMLVDDHPGMARVSARLLETLGYRTTVFDDPREALQAFRASPTGFDAVLTDLSMPQMSGEDFTRHLRELRPEVPVIVSSGMASELGEAERRRLRIDAVLVKPWRLEEAVAALQRLLG
ncbi:MAG: ATP-binding protein [Myxococcaceae bacterium]